MVCEGNSIRIYSALPCARQNTVHCYSSERGTVKVLTDKRETQVAQKQPKPRCQEAVEGPRPGVTEVHRRGLAQFTEPGMASQWK